MFELRPGEMFEPSKNVKNLWTYTRKSSFNAAGMRLPGLFTTKGFDIDAATFVAVIGLEAWGLISLVSSFGLYDAVGSFNWLGVGGVVAAFLLDLTLAIGRHLPAGANCKDENRLVLASSPHERQKIINERGLLRWLAPICAVLILAIAGVKIYLFYMLNEEQGITGLTASVLVSYILAALVHVNNTGYFLAAFLFNNRIRKEYNKWANGAEDAHEVTIYGKRSSHIEVPREEKVKIREARAGEQVIRRGKVENGESEYVMEAWGVLTDREMHALIVNQPTDNAKTTVARACLKAQLNILDADPLPPGFAPEMESEDEGEATLKTGNVTQIYPGKGRAM